MEKFVKKKVTRNSLYDLHADRYQGKMKSKQCTFTKFSLKIVLRQTYK